jgi:hypothetical protein
MPRLSTILPVGEKLLDIGRLNAGYVMGVGFIPVPFPATARIELIVAS